MAGIETGLDFYRQVLALRGYRQQILSADIANASTPGFKAVDLDFAEALKKTTSVRSGPIWQVSDTRHMTPTGTPADTRTDAATAVKYQAGVEVTLDGNSVDIEQQKRAAAENAIDYEAATTFASLKIKMLLTAINGSSVQANGG
jgi:flagellar basal-body rod protein FlgB